MKSNDWAILGLLGLGAYILLKKGGLAEAGGGGGGGGGGLEPLPFLPRAPTFPTQGVVKVNPTFQGSQFRVIGQVDRPQLLAAGAITPPTMVTYNQNLLKQPMALQGVTWKSGTAPQARPDQYWK